MDAMAAIGESRCVPPSPPAVVKRWELRRFMAVGVALATFGAVTLIPATADAAFPGADGVIVLVGRVGSSRWCHQHDEGTQLLAITPGGSDATALTCTPGNDAHPAVSPDGARVVFTNTVAGGRSLLFTLPLVLSGSRRPPDPTLVSHTLGASDDDASWSPADGTLVFQRTLRGAKTQLYTLDIATGSSATPVFPAPTGFNDTEPVFDPFDPDLLAFVRAVGGQTHIFTFDLSSHVLTDLSAQGDGGMRGDDAKPDFSPIDSGARLVFESNRACGRMQLYTMTSRGTDQEPVFPANRRGDLRSVYRCPAPTQDPAYSPAGDALVFSERTGGTDAVFTVAVTASGTAGGRPVEIARRCTSGDQADWGPLAEPPAQTPEAALPLTLPVIAVAIGGGTWAVRRQRRRGRHRRRAA